MFMRAGSVRITVRGILTEPRKPGHGTPDHAPEYPGFPKLKRQEDCNARLTASGSLAMT